jgi:SAM-dependent methyltransferase
MGKDGNSVTDNVHKRGQIVGHLLSSCDWINKRVLEIGIGVGTTMAAMSVAMLGQWKYTGTDMSAKFVARAKDYGTDAVRTDICHLPGDDGEFDRVIALDTLEHVHPDDRRQGYAEVARVTAVGGLLLINMPLQEHLYSKHESEFDHRFGLDDLHEIEQAGFMLKSYRQYFTTNEEPRPLAFVVMERQ